MNIKKSVIIGLIAVVVCGGGAYAYKMKLQGTKQAAVQVRTVAVQKGNIRSVISGTSQLEPQEQQSIVAPKEGMIKTLNLTRNQTVKKGDLLLELSDPDLDAKLDSAKDNLSTQQSDMRDLQAQAAARTITAPAGGKLTLSSNVTEGSSVSKTSKIATISDPNRLSVTLPFLAEEASQLHAGDSVELSLDGYMLTKVGTVQSVTPVVKSDAQGNRLSDVAVRVTNDGTLDAGQSVSATVRISGTEIASKGQAALQYESTTMVLAGVSGVIEHLDIKETTTVKAGERIGTITSDSLEKDMTSKQQQIDNSVKSIKDLEEQLDKLKVYAPFDGVFSTDFADPKKNVLNSYPVGTTIKANTQLGAVASLDTLQLPVTVDELDLPKVKTGLKVSISVDAIPGKTYSGEVTQVSTVGTTSNGVSTYSAVVTLKNSEELKYGMTAKAEIVLEDKRNVLVLPVDAVKQRAGKMTVELQKADGTVESNYEVSTGSNSSTFIEITNGLKEGDTVVVQTAARSQTNTSQQQNQMQNMFPGGGMPGGGMGGGMQGGGGGDGR